MKGQAVLHSAKSDLWGTPRDLFQKIHDAWRFEIDLAANAVNHLLPKWFGPDSPLSIYDALQAKWHAHAKRGWLNPPYSMCAEFTEKAARERELGFTTCMLIPSRTDTKYWHDHIWDETAAKPRFGVFVNFIKGRLVFTDTSDTIMETDLYGDTYSKPQSEPQSAPFPSVLVFFLADDWQPVK